jgi:sec-independent protein translocase protein TatC
MSENQTPKHEEQQDYEARMTFTEHLAELRTRIIRAGIAAVIGMVAAYIAGGYLIEFIMWPITGKMLQEQAKEKEAQLVSKEDGKEVEPNENETEGAPEKDQSTEDESKPAEGEEDELEGARLRLVYTNPLNPVLVRLKVAAYGGLLLAAPFIIYQICAFIFPGLRPNEKRAVRILVTGGSILAIAGVCVAYFGVLPVVVPYLMKAFLPAGYSLDLRPDETIPMIFKAILGFAIAFQFPMAVLVLVYLDLLSPQTLKQYRKIAWVVMAVGSAMLTPPDPFSMMVMLLPLTLLYEGSILMSYLVVRKRKKEASAAS